MNNFMAIDANYNFKSFFFFGEKPKGIEPTYDFKNKTVNLFIVGSLGETYFDRTSYVKLIEDIKSIKEDERIEKVNLNINSPGGALSGLVNVLMELRSLRDKKEVIAIIKNQATSAAHAIASQADKIYVENAIDSVGSLGIIVISYISDSYKMVTSNQAKKKGYDFSKESGREDMAILLSKKHDLFIDEVVKGYKGKLKAMDLNILEGQVVTAKEALELNLIDGILNYSDNISENIITKNNKKLEENIKMNLDELKAKFPNLIADLKSEFENESKLKNGKSLDILKSSAYPGPIKELAAKVIEGSENISSLNAAVAAFDSFNQREKEKTTVTKLENEIAITPAEDLDKTNETINFQKDGIICNEKDFEKAQEKIKNFA